MSDEREAKRLLRAYRWNGEFWYQDEGLLRRVRKWFAWSGGWEAHSPKRAWSGVGGRQWTLRERLGMLTPISLLGHRITFYGWGWQLRFRAGSLTKAKKLLYFSPDGTSSSATIWFRGAPPEVRFAADKHARETAERLAAVERDIHA